MPSEREPPQGQASEASDAPDTLPVSAAVLERLVGQLVRAADRDGLTLPFATARRLAYVALATVAPPLMREAEAKGEAAGEARGRRAERERLTVDLLTAGSKAEAAATQRERERCARLAHDHGESGLELAIRHPVPPRLPGCAQRHPHEEPTPTRPIDDWSH